MATEPSAGPIAKQKLAELAVAENNEILAEIVKQLKEDCDKSFEGLLDVSQAFSGMHEVYNVISVLGEIRGMRRYSDLLEEKKQQLRDQVAEADAVSNEEPNPTEPLPIV